MENHLGPRFVQLWNGQYLKLGCVFGLLHADLVMNAEVLLDSNDTRLKGSKSNELS